MKTLTTGMWLLTILLLSFTGVTVHAAVGQPISKDKGNTIYQDPRFDFSLEYPATWEMIPRDDGPQAIGSVLTLMSPSQLDAHTNSTHDPHDGLPHIVVGLYLVEREPNQRLAEWTEGYEEYSSIEDEEVTT